MHLSKVYIFDSNKFGLKNYNFEKAGIDFETHIKEQHNMWAYLYFIKDIIDKEITEITSLERFVRNKVLAGEHDWIPTNRALCLTETTTDPVELKIDQIQEQVTVLLAYMQDQKKEAKRSQNSTRQKVWKREDPPVL